MTILNRLNGAWIGTMALVLTCGAPCCEAAGVQFIRITAHTNTTVISLHSSGTVVWSNAALGGSYSVEIADSLAATQWSVVESGTITSAVQSCWINIPGTATVYTVSGKVWWGSITPVAGQPVQVEKIWQEGGDVIRATTSGPDGSFSFGQVPVGTYMLGCPGYGDFPGGGWRDLRVVDGDIHWDQSGDAPSVTKYFTGVSPARYSTTSDTTPLITWDAMPECVDCRIDIDKKVWTSEDSWHSEDVVRASTGATSYQVVDALSPGTYLLEIWGYDAGGECAYTAEIINYNRFEFNVQ